MWHVDEGRTGVVRLWQGRRNLLRPMGASIQTDRRIRKSRGSVPRAGGSGGRGGGAARVRGAASIPERKQSSLGVSRSGDGRRMRGQLRATAPTPILTPNSILSAHQGSGSSLPGQAGSWNLPQAGGAQGGSQSPGRGTTLVGGTWSSPVWPRDTLPTVPQC